ncbi:MAG: hypothetical protein V2J55_08110 [Candidatus Competibacteraceae bacterium]|jgi:hypothetical protein|nr:hypothetical protein [Candidatus Competibacteraceae bacterium]
MRLDLSSFGRVVVLLALLLLGGCAQTDFLNNAFLPGSSSFPGSDPSDTCNSQVQAFQGDVSYFQQPLFTKVAGQNVGGLIDDLGNIVGGLVTNPGGSRHSSAQLKQSIVDFAGETLRDTTKGYLTNLAQQTGESPQGMYNRIDSDATSDSVRLNNVKRKITNLERCRQGQVSDISSRHRRGQISAREAKQEYQDVQNLVRRDNRFIEELVGQSGERVEVYAEADQYVAKKRSPARKKKSRPSKGVRQASKAQKQAKTEQAKMQNLDNVIERRKTGIS